MLILYWTRTWLSAVKNERLKKGKRVIFPGLCSWLSLSRESARIRETEREREKDTGTKLWWSKGALLNSVRVYIPVASLDKGQETRLYKFTKETRSNRGHKAKRQSITNFSSVQLLSNVWLFATPWITAPQASLSMTNSQSLLKSNSIESVMLSNHLVLFCPLLLLPPIPPSSRVFSYESTPCMRWPNYWSFSFNISPSNEHPGLISYTIDWLDLLAVQGTLKSLFQYHSSKASIFRCSVFFTV